MVGEASTMVADGLIYDSTTNANSSEGQKKVVKDISSTVAQIVAGLSGLDAETAGQTAANAGQNAAENNALETVWDLASLSMSLVELGVAINDGDALDIALAGGSVIIDGLSVLVPGGPGGTGYLLKASKTADGKLVAKVVDEAGDTYKVVDNKLYDDAGNIVKSTDNSASTGTKVTSNGASSGGTKANSVAASQSDVSVYFQQNRNFWTEEPIHFDGNKVYQRNDLIDPMKVDPRSGKTNLELMQAGRAPLGPDNRPINLHHLTQKQDGAIAEVTQTLHSNNHGALHMPNMVPSGINRAKFSTWRRNYWKNRANGF